MSEETQKLEDLQKRAEVLAINAKEPEFSKGEALFIVGFFGACIAGIGALFWASIKEEERLEEEALARAEEKRQNKEALERWLNNQENAGNKVYKLTDGRYLSVDREAKQSTHLVTEIQEDYRNSGLA